MKKLLILALAVAGAVAPFTAFAERSDTDRVEDVYDLFNPSAVTNRIGVWVNGDSQYGRVSFKKGKNPLITKDDKGQPLMTPDPAFKTEYASLEFYGGEDSRAFNLHAWRAIEPNVWYKFVVNFVPRIDGKVKVEISGGYHPGFDRYQKDYPPFSYFRITKLEITGAAAPITDPGLTKPKVWGVGKFYHAEKFSNKIKAEVIPVTGAPTPKCFRSPLPIYQYIKVKKDQPVTISFYACSDDTFNSKK